MKKMITFIAAVFLLTMPVLSECRTVAFSPSIPGQPLIFHFDTSESQVHPSQFSATTWAQLENALLIRSSYSQHLENLVNKNCCAQWNFWVDGMEQWQQQNAGHKQQLGYQVNTSGVTLGAETYSNDFLVGVAASYTNSNLHWRQSGGNSQIDSYYSGLYGSWNKECLYINATVLGSFSDYHTSRHYHFRTIDDHAHSSHNSWEALAGIEAGLLLQNICCKLDLIPFIGIDYVNLSQQRYNERKADSFNFTVKRRNDQLIQSEIGFKFMRFFLCGYNNWRIAPNLSLGYINQSPLTGRSFHTGIVDSDQDINVKGWDFERNLGAIALNFNFTNCEETFSLTLHYDGQFGKNYWNQTASIMSNLCY